MTTDKSERALRFVESILSPEGIGLAVSGEVRDMARDVLNIARCETGVVTSEQNQQDHPLPWKVEYYQRFDTWHPKAFPRVIDADGHLVCEMPQNVTAGAYDVIADGVVQKIVGCVNSVGERCPECGYTVTDCHLHLDHDRCARYPFFGHETDIDTPGQLETT